MSVIVAGIDHEPRAAASPHDARREKLKYIQAARVIAILLVVATHARDPFAAGDIVRSPAFSLFMRSINLVFIFVSGFLFQYLADRFEYGRYLRTKLKNVILPYLICSIPAIAMYMVGVKEIENLGAPAFIDTPIKALPFMILTGTHLAPFWFIPVMAIYYLLAPLFLAVDRAPKAYAILAPLLVVSFIVSRSPGDTYPLHNALFYAPVYLGGMAVSHFRHTLIPLFGKLYPLLFLGVFLPLLSTASGPTLDGIYLFSKILVCLAIVGALYRWVGDLPDWIIRIGDMSFGVYFIHYYIVAAMVMVFPKLPWLRVEGVGAYLVLCALIMGLSLAAVHVVQRIMGRYSRQLIGA